MSFAEEVRRTIEAAPRQALPQVASLMWRAFSASQITEGEAEELQALIELKRIPPAVAKPVARRAGSTPRSLRSLERKRQWSTSGRLPPSLSAKFAPAEVAVLSVLAVEVKRAGSCRWPHARLAAVAGVSESSVKRAMKAARALGLIQIEERKVSAFRNDPNVVEIVSPAWRGWLRLGGGGQSWPATNKKISQVGNAIVEATLGGDREGRAARADDIVPESRNFLPGGRIGRSSAGSCRRTRNSVSAVLGGSRAI